MGFAVEHGAGPLDKRDSAPLVWNKSSVPAVVRTTAGPSSILRSHPFVAGRKLPAFLKSDHLRQMKSQLCRCLHGDVTGSLRSCIIFASETWNTADLDVAAIGIVLQTHPWSNRRHRHFIHVSIANAQGTF